MIYSSRAIAKQHRDLLPPEENWQVVEHEDGGYVLLQTSFVTLRKWLSGLPDDMQKVLQDMFYDFRLDSDYDCLSTALEHGVRWGYMVTLVDRTAWNFLSKAYYEAAIAEGKWVKQEQEKNDE